MVEGPNSWHWPLKAKTRAMTLLRRNVTIGKSVSGNRGILVSHMVSPLYWGPPPSDHVSRSAAASSRRENAHVDCYQERLALLRPVHSPPGSRRDCRHEGVAHRRHHRRALLRQGSQYPLGDRLGLRCLLPRRACSLALEPR